MISLKLTSVLVSSRYVAALGRYRFDSCLELLIALFSYYSKGTQDWEALTMLLERTGFTSFTGLNDQQLTLVREQARRLHADWSYEMDAERLGYLLAAAIDDGRVVMLLDKTVVSEIAQPLLVSDQSLVAFVDVKSLNHISFSSL